MCGGISDKALRYQAVNSICQDCRRPISRSLFCKSRFFPLKIFYFHSRDSKKIADRPIIKDPRKFKIPKVTDQSRKSEHRHFFTKAAKILDEKSLSTPSSKRSVDLIPRSPKVKMVALWLISKPASAFHYLATLSFHIEPHNQQWRRCGISRSGVSSRPFFPPRK